MAANKPKPNIAKSINKEKLRKKYFENKKQLDIIRSDATLAKWKYLSENFKLGKKIWGKDFTKVRLARDMEIPITTVLRCISLDRATPKTLKLIKEGKISAFKAAMVCQLKNNKFQDEVIAIVIKDKLSTYQIKSFKPYSIKDVNNWRHEKAVEKGYAREDTAFRSFNIWIERGFRFLLMPISTVGKKHQEDIIVKLKILRKRIDTYIELNEP